MWSVVLFIGIYDYFVFFKNSGAFFQGDKAIYWLQFPYESFREFLRGFLFLDPAGWYRPLTQRTLPSLLYPTFGLDNPTPYRAVLLLFLVFNTIAVFRLARVVGGSVLAASLAALFFNTHTVNAYTSYAVALFPEVMYTLCYLLSASLNIFRHPGTG